MTDTIETPWFDTGQPIHSGKCYICSHPRDDHNEKKGSACIVPGCSCAGYKPY